MQCGHSWRCTALQLSLHSSAVRERENLACQKVLQKDSQRRGEEVCLTGSGGRLHPSFLTASVTLSSLVLLWQGSCSSAQPSWCSFLGRKLFEAFSAFYSDLVIWLSEGKRARREKGSQQKLEKGIIHHVWCVSVNKITWNISVAI